MFFLFLPGLVLAAEIGTALKADQIRKEPYSDALVTGSLARGERLEILSKKGAWLKIKTTKAAGWVRLLSVKRGTSGGKQTAGLQDLASGRAGTGQVVATTGVRGLNEEELKSAKYNAAEVKKLESYTQTAKQGELFAKSGALKSIKVVYLPEPQQEGEK
ncbi:MAG: SH3 domain-containing protein [Desulfobacteraceae bacterium]|nr:MAG: SH3 domain-containing protein [Desulfobacteraceae bacterium]